MNVQLTKDQPDVTEPTTGPHLPTVAWGLTLVAVAVLAVVREVTEWRLDVGLVAAAGMVVMGALLVTTALITLVRQGRRRGKTPPP